VLIVTNSLRSADGVLAQETAHALLDAIDKHVQNAWRMDGDGRSPRVAHYPGARAESFRGWAARFLLPVIEGLL